MSDRMDKTRQLIVQCFAMDLPGIGDFFVSPIAPAFDQDTRAR